MGVNTKSFDNASDMITFSRASGAYGFTKVSYGSELVSNGDFSDGSTGWNLNPTTGTMEVVNGKLVATNATAVGGQAFTNLLSGYAIGTPYEISFTVSDYVSGTVRLSVGNTYSGYVSSNGTFNFVIPYTSGLPRVYFSIGNTSLSIDNISVKEVLYNSSDPSATLKLIYHPNDVPRIEYNVDGSAKGILIEEARTNLVTYSEDLSTWYASVTVTDNSVTSPAQLQNASTLTSYSSGTSYGIDRGGITVTAGDHTLSAYFKANGFNYGKLTWYSAANSTQYAVFNLATGEVHGGIYDDAGIQDVGNGWYRCHITTSLNATSSGGGYAWISDGTLGRSSGVTGDGIKGIHAYGIQLEAGSFPTSYIKTTGATATRAVDVASIGVSNFGYNQTEGTLFVDFKTPDTANANALELGNSASSSRYIIRNGLAYYSASGLGAQVVLGYTASTNNQRVGFAVQSNDAVAVVNGSTVGTDNTVTLFSNPTILGIGARAYNLATEKLNGHIKSIQYYPRRLTDAQLQELTT